MLFVCSYLAQIAYAFNHSTGCILIEAFCKCVCSSVIRVKQVDIQSKKFWHMGSFCWMYALFHYN